MLRVSKLALVVSLAFNGAAQAALPTGAQVASGSVQIGTVGKTMTITNSPSAIINWQSFSIGQSHAVKFVQQSASSSVLNRVVGGQMSAIMGRLTSNGQVFLINPAGDCHWVHAGDSRVYHFHGNKLVKRTMDHSYVQTLVDKGEITEEEANVHPQSNILMGCLGTEDDPPIDVHFIPQLRPGDVLMACSDGVSITSAPMSWVLCCLHCRRARRQNS